MPALSLRIDNLAYGGDGVGRLTDGRVVFVPGTCPGDTVELDVREDHERWLRADIARILEPSPERVEPECPYVGTCGGCQWQHVAYDAQVREKAMIISEALRRIARIPQPPTVTCEPSSLQYGYRNRVELTVAEGDGPVTLGFMGAGATGFVPVESCHLLPPAYRKAPRALRGALRYLQRRESLGIERIGIRVATNGQSQVDLWTTAGEFPRAMVAKVVADATGARTVTRVVFRPPIAARDVSNVEVLHGPGAWEERLGVDTYLVSAPSFFQANSSGAERLREIVTAAVAEVSPTSVADIYAGVGTFTLPLARIAPSTTALEDSGYAVRDLRRNAERAGLDVDIEPGDAARSMSRLAECDVAVVDPPRSGLDPSVIDSLADLGLRRLVYVSCDPATFARDATRLTASGLRLTAVTGIDLFPQTYHVETIAVFDAD